MKLPKPTDTFQIEINLDGDGDLPEVKAWLEAEQEKSPSSIQGVTDDGHGFTSIDLSNPGRHDLVLEALNGLLVRLPFGTQLELIVYHEE
jgi:hypothetical protein